MFTHMSWRHWQNTFLIAAAFAWPKLAMAQVDAPAEETNVLRTYQVGDLILDIHDYPYSESLRRAPSSGRSPGGGGMGGGGGLFSVPEDTSATSFRGRDFAGAGAALRLCQFGGGGQRETAVEQDSSGSTITMNDLIRVITSTVAPETWVDNGGEANIRPLGTVLVILQTPGVHDLIRDLLLQIRAASSDRRTMTIDARWLLLTSDDLDSLVLPDQQGVPEVDPKRLAEFTRRPGSIRGITSCFSGQLVYIVGGSRQNFVSGYIPVVGSLDTPNRSEQLASEQRQSLIRLVSDRSAVFSNRDSQVGYQPVIEKPNLGALLEIRPTRSPSNGQSPAAIVDLKSTITAPGLPQPELGGNAQSAAIAPAIDRIAVETLEFATTLRMPLEKPILVGGLTCALPSDGRSHPSGVQEAVGEKPQLYFVLEVR